MNTVTITATKEGNLAFRAPYNQSAIEELKANIPACDRKWDAVGKTWVVLPAYGDFLVELGIGFYGETPRLPVLKNTAPAELQTCVFNMRYLGKCKLRYEHPVAYGWADGCWKLNFPESVLREWFGAEKRPGEEASLYSVLAVAPAASGAEIKTGWRRLIRQWHPDVNKDPDAAEQFQAIQAAYETLSDPARRARYDAGLILERSFQKHANTSGVNTFAASIGAEYSPPLRCGYVMCEGKEQLGQFAVSKILEWQDITNSRGEILVTSWPRGADMFVERWVRA